MSFEPTGPPPLPEQVRVYLSGAIEQAPDGGLGWRRSLAEHLRREMGHYVHLPTAYAPAASVSGGSAPKLGDLKADPSRFREFQAVLRPIIRRDLAAVLQHTDYVVAFWDSHVLGGAGTHGEITLAFYFGIPVYLVLGMPRAETSAWILGCSEEVFDSFELLKARLLVLNEEGRLRRRMPGS